MPAICRLETFHTEFVCFVKATAEDGAVGWGQTSTYNADITAAVFHRQIAPWALGQASEDIAALVARIERAEHKFPGTYRNRAMAGLDTALWDMAGKRAGVPVTALIGGTPGPVRAYASSMQRDIFPHDEAERLKRICSERGFTAAKFRIGAECGRDVDQWPGRTEEIIPIVTQALTGIDTLGHLDFCLFSRLRSATGCVMQCGERWLSASCLPTALGSEPFMSGFFLQCRRIPSMANAKVMPGTG